MNQLSFEKALGRRVSRETFQRLDAFVALVLKWQRRINLIAPSTIESIWSRHVADSARLASCAVPASSWVDIGSGGGFPGLVLAILAQEEKAPTAFHLVESNGKKVAFLREAARILAPNVLVHDARAEVFLQPPRDADIISARALAPMVDLIAWAEPLLIRGSLGLFMKGQEVQSEYAAAQERFPFCYATRPHGGEASGAFVAVWQGDGFHPLLSDPKGWTIQRF
jgi:16S rRNA (guanine527-N7)-methyltransferase